MRVFFVSTALLLLSLSWNQGASAQVNEKFADMAADIELLRGMAQVERQAVVADNMRLTDQEATAFWPVYKAYRADVAKINDRLVKVITDYAAERDTLTDAQAKALIANYFSYEQDLLRTRKKYVARFDKALPMVKVGRFYQIDNKLNAITMIHLALGIPLAKQ